MTTTTEPAAPTLDVPRPGSVGLAERLRWQDVSAFQPIDGASLGFVRIGFGLMTAWEGVRYLDRGWVDKYYGGEQFTFTYWPFDAIQPLPGPFLVLPWVLMIVAGLWLASGVKHRGAAALAWLTLSYTLLSDKSQYLNHVYLMALISLLLIVVPAGNALTLGRGRSRTVPTLAVDLVAIQVAVPYVFGGIAKLNGDWINGRPLVMWLAAADDVPLIGPLLAIPEVGHVLAVASIVFDLTIIGLLLWRRTQPFAFAVMVLFHLLNARLFSIGVFPWTMILLTTIFLAPNWPRAVMSSVADRRGHRPLIPVVGATVIGGAVGAWFFPTVVAVHVVTTAFGFGLAAWLIAGRGGERAAPTRLPSSPVKRVGWHKPALVAAAIWVAVQVVVPLRHHLYPTDVHWAEDGHRFSWRMKLRDKDGTLDLTIRTTDGRLAPVNLESHLRPRQISQMATRPDMVVQFAHHLEEEAGHDIQVFADSFVSLNGRASARYIRPDVDLTTVDLPDFGPAWYVTPGPGGETS